MDYALLRQQLRADLSHPTEALPRYLNAPAPDAQAAAALLQAAWDALLLPPGEAPAALAAGLSLAQELLPDVLLDVYHLAYQLFTLARLEGAAVSATPVRLVYMEAGERRGVVEVGPGTVVVREGRVPGEALAILTGDPVLAVEGYWNVVRAAQGLGCFVLEEP